MKFLLRCIACNKEYKPTQAKYTCLSCRNNLRVVYDYKTIGKKFKKSDLKKNNDYSIWRYFPILPFVDDKILKFRPSLQIGWTPLHFARNLSKKLGVRNLYLKDDTKTPSCSFKDRASAVVILKGIESGVKVFTAASTGNAGCALACLCANLNLPCVIFVPEKAPEAKIAQLLIFGAKVIAVKGSYDDAFDLSLKAADKFNWYCRSTGYNPYTREGKKTAALEIYEQMNWSVPELIFVPVGDGNIISGIWKGFKDLYEVGFIENLPKLIAVQSKSSNAISKAYQRYIKTGKIEITPVKAKTIADSISVNLPRDGLAAVQSIIESNGFAVEVSDEEILNAVKILAESEGIFSEPAGAASIAGLKKLIDENRVSGNEKIVCLVTGNGLKDIKSASKVAGKTIKIEPTIDALKSLKLII